MFAFLKKFERKIEPCPRCNGSGSVGILRRHPCPDCNGIGQKELRPSWVGPALVGTFIFCFFLIMAISFLIAKPADAAGPGNETSINEGAPTFEIIVEKIGPGNTAETSECHVSNTYPESVMQWCQIITKYAHANNIPSDLIAAVILQESGGDASAYSSSGAVGLMQIMPRDGIAATFQCINGPCFASRPTIEELLNPDFNIAYGSHMLAGLIARLGIHDALKAYGPMDVGDKYADNILNIYENYQK